MSLKKPKETDPFFGLKYIAFCRTGLPANEEDLDEEAMLQFAKWQVCKVRNILWNDPKWDSYTSQEILIEYFAIKFDQDTELRKDFEISTISTKQADVDWFAKKEAQLKAEKAKNSKIKEEVIAGGNIEDLPKTPQDFEDKF